MMLLLNTKKEEQILVVIGGKEYGTGSSRDWAAKGTKLLGDKSSNSRKFRKDPSFKFNWDGYFAITIN